MHLVHDPPAQATGFHSVAFSLKVSLMNPFKKMTGEQLTAWRAERGLSVQRLADKLGKEPEDIKAMEAGEQRMTPCPTPTSWPPSEKQPLKRTTKPPK